MRVKKDPWILGLGAADHNGAACLLRGDEIVIAIQEERLLRRKRAGLYVAQYSRAIEHCLEYAEIRPEDLSLVVCCAVRRAKTPEQNVLLNPTLQLERYGIPTLYIPHHYGHAYSVFATSGYKESAVLVIDGAGAPIEDLTIEERMTIKGKRRNGHEAISLYAASGASIKPLEKHLFLPNWVITGQDIGPAFWEADCMPTFSSLGVMYATVAYQIFGSFFDAGKVMGLAPYGEPEIPASEFFVIEDGSLVFRDSVPNLFRHRERWPLRKKEYSNLACSTQAALEEAVLYFADHLYKLSPSENLCYAGGVALNSVANERIIRESAFKNVHIMPAAEDSGTAIGAAYYGLWQLTKNNSRKKLVCDAVGPIYSEQRIHDAIKNMAAVETIDSKDIISDTVDLLCGGKIIGWFDGRSELGPRALGQRSILCDPRRPDAKDTLNNRVKHREAFRPFAPAVLIERVNEWFDFDGIVPESPFMLRVCKFKNEKKAQVPGVVHVDDTGRLQTVTLEANSYLHQLVTKFHEKTGVPIILNTSFNVSGEPIVETPEDALDTMLSTGIDYCVLGGKIVTKRREILFERNEIPWPQRIRDQIRDILNATATEKDEVRAPTERVNQQRSLDCFVGRFEHQVQGTIKIEREGERLKATITGGMMRQIHAGLSAPLNRLHRDAFEITGDHFAGVKIIFLPDRRRRVNLLAMILKEDGLTNDYFFRMPNTVGFETASYHRFIGKYRKLDQRMNVILQDDKLMVLCEGSGSYNLVPISETKFVLNRLPGYAIEFKVNTLGTVIGAVVTQPNNVIVLKKYDI
jgi:carbamoyltransferase